MRKICLLCDTTDLFYRLYPKKKKVHYGRLLEWVKTLGEVTKAIALGHFSTSGTSQPFVKSLEKLGYIPDFTSLAENTKYLPISASKLMNHVNKNVRDCDHFVLAICSQGFGEALDALTQDCVEYTIVTVPGSAIDSHPLAKDKTLYITNDLTFDIRRK